MQFFILARPDDTYMPSSGALKLSTTDVEFVARESGIPPHFFATSDDAEEAYVSWMQAKSERSLDATVTEPIAVVVEFDTSAEGVEPAPTPDPAPEPQPDPEPDIQPEPAELWLIDATASERIAIIGENDVFAPPASGSFTVELASSLSFDSVEFSGTYSKTESTRPYYLFGDREGLPIGKPAIGQHTVRAKILAASGEVLVEIGRSFRFG